ncbi:hypothetical protein M8J75_012900 [Diaphorina citri]|nr:hypothetical protein M8J75_012900 [Diaphorina citri]
MVFTTVQVCGLQSVQASRNPNNTRKDLPGLPPVQRTEDLTGTERRRVSGEHATGIGDLQELIELMKELQLICDLKSLIEKVKKLIPKLREAKTDLERIQACLDLANLDD